MELETILTLLSIGLGVIATVAGVFWGKARGKLTAVKNLSKEVFDLVRVATDAIEDDKITKEEIAKIKQEAIEVRTAWRVLVGKVV
ncbi:hypothetical protein LCGC14_2661340 [marine sediment metagenome]|uniref:Uncharacterized protein n=1 Tax=marine sediment metagenome TaxID=412755 RepID=A0A0F8ZRZ5_9ZZZZ